jgi:VanZ family protein
MLLIFATSCTSAFLLTLAFAISDEWHQTFVPGRGGAVMNVLVDSLGAMIAALGALKASPATFISRQRVATC